MKYLLITIAALTISSFAINDATAEIFLKIEGIDGESTVQGHEKEIEINSLQFGAARAIGSPVGDPSQRTSPPSASDVMITKAMDKASPKLLGEALTGKSHNKVEIFLTRQQDNKLFTYAQYTLEDVLVSGYSASSGGDKPAESLSLNYVKITTEFTPVDGTGKPGTPILFCYDFANGNECTTQSPDVDECANNTDNCDANAACTNTPGSFTCTCNTGYTGNGVTCTDINECTIGQLVCPQNSICVNDPGSAHCQCQPPFISDGGACVLDTDGDGIPPSTDQDDDNDGIADAVDSDPLVSSNDFADDDPVPITSGTISRGDQSITIIDEADPEGVRTTAAPGGGPNPAVISACSNSAVISLDAGEEAVLTCSSVDVEAVTGTVDVTFTGDDGTVGTTTLDAGESITFEPQTFTITNNGSTDVVVIVNGNPITVPSGDSVDVDTEPPTITVPNDITTEATGPLTVVPLGTATATDNEDPSPVITNDAPTSFPVGTTTVTWTATDASGNSASDTQEVTVTDTTPPTIDPHADITILTSNQAGVTVTYEAPATHDLVDGDGTATCNPLSGTVFAPGHTTVTCSATDSRGNQAIDSFFDVFVDLDAIPPEAYNQFDPATKNVLVFGTDDHPGMPTMPISPTSVTPAKWNAEDDEDREDHRTNAEIRTYEIADAAGNKMTLKEIVKLKGKEIKVKVLSIQYGDDAPIKPDKNKKAFEWSLNKDGTIKELEQKMTAKDGKSKQDTKAKYSSKKDQTKIESEKPKAKLTKQGLALLQMHTANGKLVVKY